MASVICSEQSYFVAGRTKKDNLFLLHDLLATTELLSMNTGLVSLDQEKAFNGVNHDFLFQALETFGFGTLFTLTI